MAIAFSQKQSRCRVAKKAVMKAGMIRIGAYINGFCAFAALSGALAIIPFGFGAAAKEFF
jgi:hypothetical protein